MYEILLERRAEKDLRKLSSELFQRIIAKIQSLSENPKPQGSRKITGSKTIGEFVLEIIARFTKLMNKKNV